MHVALKTKSKPPATDFSVSSNRAGPSQEEGGGRGGGVQNEAGVQGPPRHLVGEVQGPRPAGGSGGQSRLEAEKKYLAFER